MGKQVGIGKYFQYICRMNKSILFLVFFFVLSLYSFSQNWSVINPTDKFNYRLDNDPIVTATIYADSSALFGSDSVYYLNRVMCNTCATVIGGPDACNTCYSRKNMPQFMQRKCVISNSGIINFRDTANIILNMLAMVNDTWLLDSNWNVSATVISIQFDSVFGNSDSTKTILLSTGDTIILSKNFGILLYPNKYNSSSYYRLVGIEGRNLGEHVPNFWDFFDFDIGDMFEYQGQLAFEDNCTWDIMSYCSFIKKYWITGKLINSDTLTYQISGIYYQNCQVIFGSNFCIGGFPYSGSEQYIDSTNHWLNKYKGETIRLRDIVPPYYPDNVPCDNNDSAYNSLVLAQDAHGLQSKLLGRYSPDSMLCYDFVHNALNNLSDTLFTAIHVGYYVVAKVGLGVTIFQNSGCFERDHWEQLIAYRKGNDTVGVFSNDSYLLGLKEDVKMNDEINIFPNPAQTSITISSETQQTLEFFDVLGQKITSIIANPQEKTAVDISSFPNVFFARTAHEAKKIVRVK